MAKLIVKRERQATRIGTNQICPYSQYHNEKFGHPGGASIGCVFNYGSNIHVALFPTGCGHHEQVHRKVWERSAWTKQLYPNLGPCRRTRKEVKELERGGLWGDCGGVLRGNTMERRGRVGSSDVLEALKPVQLYLTPWELGAALLNGKNGDNKKSVGVVDEINEGNADIVVDRDCELTCGCELCQSTTAVSKSQTSWWLTNSDNISIGKNNPTIRYMLLFFQACSDRVPDI